MLTNGLTGTTEATATTATNTSDSQPDPAASTTDQAAPDDRIFPASQSAREAAARC